MTHITFLNEEVKAEVENSPALYLAWRLVYNKYDNEIDPLHNPDYVKAQKEIEVERLENIKGRVDLIMKEAKELTENPLPYPYNFDEYDWNSFHDVVVEALELTEEVNKESLRKIFELLPDQIRSKAIQWDMSDTVFRDDVYVWLQDERFNQKIAQKLAAALRV